ncbi:MAG TPA: beta-ketoacyl synthase N-terminal-like domain-containing protein, partial [Thermoanaerobaculia bacterium]|nr:beta-ketoacyl synthase N-terminal-like domain-containing protein [Thermoanaerobaculia bacterium]
LATTPEDSLLSWMPLTHDMGLIAFHLAGVAAGVHQHLMPTQLFVRRPVLWLQKASEHRATVLYSPNFGLHYLLSSFRPEVAAGWDLSRVRICNGAEPISAAVCRRFTAALAPWGLPPHAIFPCYGLAEACVAVTAQPLGEQLAVYGVDRRSLAVGSRVAEVADGPQRLELVECGVPLRSCRVRVCDDEGGELGEGSIGHIEIQGSNVTRGYYADSEATRCALPPEAWLRTGDLGFLRRGRLVVAGRAKDLILVGGRNFYPHDLERLAEAAGGLEPGKIAACALPEPADGREAAALFVQWKGPLAELAPLADRIASHVLREAGVELVHVVPVRRLPRTTSGKVQRHRLVESWRAGEFAASVAELAALRRAAPATGSRLPELLALVEAEARRISGAPRIDPDRPLGEQGFDSQKAVALTTALGRALGAELPAALVFDHPSPRALARFLAGEKGAPQAESAGAVHDEPIAVIGLGCRFPGGSNGPEGFWRLLDEGTDAVREIPAERWDAAVWYDPDPDTAGKMVIRHGGFLDAIDRFDNGFFAVSAPEAEALDPQQRLLLEVSWGALEHAGLDVARLAGSRTGVFVGLCGAEYARQHLHSGDPARIDAYSLTGVALSTAAGRLSYVYGFRGPCLTVDTACSSSLAAVHLAVRSLRSGESALALAGGVNLILGPEVHLGFSRLHAMARDGRCKTFDAAADGYARSEGCGLVVLKRLSDARAAGDRVLAVIRGSAMNQDGTTHGLTAPSGVAQQEVIRLALADAGVTPAAVQYVEAHGTGTPLGDPQEMAALAAVYGQDRPADEPLLVGSVKTNLGHTEAAAGVAALLKVVLALAHETIPRHLHL